MSNTVIVRPQVKRVIVRTPGPQGPAGASEWSGITGKPSTFPPESHTHPSTQISTTQTDVAGTSYALTDSDHGKVVRFTSSSAVAVSVDNSVRSDFSCVLLQDGSGQVTVTGSGVTVRNRQGHTKTAGQYALATLIKVASGEMRLGGDTA